MKRQIILFSIIALCLLACTKPTKVKFQYYTDNAWEINNSAKIHDIKYMNVSDEITRSNENDEVYLIRDTIKIVNAIVSVENFLFIRNNKIKRIWSNFYYHIEDSTSMEIFKNQILKSYDFKPLVTNAKNILDDQQYSDKDLNIEVSISKENKNKLDLTIDVKAQDY